MRIIALLASLSFLVLIHEGGHFLFAKLFKTRIEQFYLFFNPYFSILRAKKYEGKWHFSFFSKKAPEEFAQYPDNTEWGIGWIPLGGYCAIGGMIDETHTSADALNKEPEPWEYRSKKAWQRLLIVAGGVLVNFIGALVIFSMLLFVWGKDSLHIQDVPEGYDYCQTALDNGFRNGDKILYLDGRKVTDMKDAVNGILLDNSTQVVVERDGERKLFTLSKDFGKKMIGAGEKQFAVPRVPFVIGSFSEGSLAEKSGMKLGDSIVSLNGTPAESFAEFVARINRYAGQKVTIGYYRNGVKDSVSMTLGKEAPLLGAGNKDFTKDFHYTHTDYGFFESIPKGIAQGTSTLVSYVKQFKYVFSKEGATQVGGFGAIGSLFPETWDWQIFWNMTAFLSIILAFMNILPIPALDGGHVLFTLWEMVTGRKPSDKFMEKAQMVGMILLFALLIYANGNDLIKWISGKL